MLRPASMALRITSSPGERQFVVHVHGSLDAVGAGLLHAEVARAPADLLVLDLSGLMRLDEAGTAALRALVAGGARIDGASPYVKLLLGMETGASPRRAPRRRAPPP